MFDIQSEKAQISADGNDVFELDDKGEARVGSADLLHL